MKVEMQYNEEFSIVEKIGEIKAEKPRLIKGNKTRRHIIMWVAVVFIAFFCIIARYSYITQLNYDVAKLEKTLSDQTAKNSALQMELDKIMNLPQVRYIAESQLGMQKPDTYQTVYIEVPRCDEVKVKEQPKSFYEKLLVTIEDIRVSLINIKSIFG
ncbi:MAG: cell division protein FtsL [Clostridia bacterium]|nr:cell division protein FtsL [Clostridia bacterium]